MFQNWRAQIKIKEESDSKQAFLKADGNYTLDTVVHGSLKNAEDTDFVATNERFDFALKPNSQNENEGTGILSYKDKVSFANFFE